MPKRKKRQPEYVAICVGDEHIVTSISVIKDYRELSNGFMFNIGNKVYFSPYFFQSDDLPTCWRFAAGCEATANTGARDAQDTYAEITATS